MQPFEKNNEEYMLDKSSCLYSKLTENFAYNLQENFALLIL